VLRDRNDTASRYPFAGGWAELPFDRSRMDGGARPDTSAYAHGLVLTIGGGTAKITNSVEGKRARRFSSGPLESTDW